MPDPFVHLHVASGYSLQYGASHPETLVERAVEQEMDTLALTDRDGAYGAVKFTRACVTAGIRPVLGVDLAYRAACPEPGVKSGGPAAPRTRTPVRGGAYRDEPHPRVTLLASAGTSGRAGWAAVCRMVSATQLAGERGRPVADPEAGLAAYLAGGDVMVLLGPDSEVGAAVARRRDDLALAAIRRWRELVPAENLQVELVSHRLSGRNGWWGPGSATHAARMAGVARRAGVGAVLSNAVRYADRRDAPTIDVLDAARRLVALGSAGLRDVGPSALRGNAEGFLKSGKQMQEVAEEICRLAGLGSDGGEREARRLLAHTRAVADRCALDPRRDLGLGEVHFPEFDLSRSSDQSGEASAQADLLLRTRCEGAIGRRYPGLAPSEEVALSERLDHELRIIEGLGYASYFLTVGDVTDLIKQMGVRCAARGSGAGSLVNYLLGVSGVDPIRHHLLMERFLSPLRQALPDIDVDVESARRTEVYEAILDRYGGERCVCVSMMDTYRVRHAVRDVGAALGMPPAETDAIAKAFPHIRARDARVALRELPELRLSGLGEEKLDLFFSLVERLDGLPRHIAVHPCGVLLSDATLLDRTPVEASFAGFPMSQFDKDDVEDLGLLKLDVLGIRMQSSMAHAIAEIRRVDGVEIDLDDEAQVPFDDPATFRMISAAKTLGVFQIESPGQRELVGRSGIETFEQIIADISLFRPGPVKSDMITPYLEVKQGWKPPSYLHDDLVPILGETHGVVVFHEQVIEMIAVFAGIDLAEADEKRRALGDFEGMAETKRWFFPCTLGRGYALPVVEGVWKILEAFASFGFCKAHAAAFALPTYQSAWLKAHWPAHFLAGVLTHDPGMYPKRLILDDVRQCGIAVLGLDVNASEQEYVVERVGLLDEPPPEVMGGVPRAAPTDGHPDGRAYGIRLALGEVKGISEAEVRRIVAARPYHSLTDFWHRAPVSRPILERLVLAGGFDSVYGIGSALGGYAVRRRAVVTRRDLLLQVAELDRQTRAADRASRGGRRARGLSARPARSSGLVADRPSDRTVALAVGQNSTDPLVRSDAPARATGFLDGRPARDGVWAQSSAQSRATPSPQPVTSVQLALDLGDHPDETVSGLPEMTDHERMNAELEILGLDVSRHVVAAFDPLLDALGVTRSRDLLRRRSKAELLVAGVKVATQTPPIRSGRRVVFLTLDDGTGPVDATFFEDAQGPYAATVFGSWLLLVRGELRRTGHRGVSLRATGAWALPELDARWRAEGGGPAGLDAVRAVMAAVPLGFAEVGVADPNAVSGGPPEGPLKAGAMERGWVSFPGSDEPEDGAEGETEGQSDGQSDRRRKPGGPDRRGGHGAAGGMGRRRVLVHSSGFQLSPYADVKPAGDSVKDSTKQVARKLWHRSPGSPG